VIEVQTRHDHGYLASLVDCFSRRCVGWAVSKYNDTALTLAALNQALAQRQPEPGLIHHTDRGSPYTSTAYQQRLREVGARVSHSRPGRPQENGMSESLKKTIRYGHLYLEDASLLAEVEANFTDWVEQCYNARRLHSALNYVAPNVFEQQWCDCEQEQLNGLV
jgi:putative transposase